MHTTESRHGHDVLNLIADTSIPFTIKTLHSYVEQHWGENVRFHTCKLNDLSLDALLTFFLSLVIKLHLMVITYTQIKIKSVTIKTVTNRLTTTSLFID